LEENFINAGSIFNMAEVLPVLILEMADRNFLPLKDSLLFLSEKGRN
jgi:hypothetical protein